LRLALATLAVEEGKWEALLGKSPAWRTNATRGGAAQNLAGVQTVLSRLTPKDDATANVELASALEKLGL
jgi:hypothetical protein